MKYIHRGHRAPQKFMRILVTGGAGFIGSHLVEGLGNRGHEIVVLDDLSTGSVENLQRTGIACDLVVGDLRDREVVRRAMEGVDAVIHHAARISVADSVQNLADTGSVNIHGTSILLEEARRAGARRVVLASSSAVYGDGAPPLTELHPTYPLSPYGVQKLTTEHLARTVTLTGGPDTVSLRYFNVFGRRQRADSAYAAAIPVFARSASDGRAPTIFGDGMQTRDFVHVSDIVEANRRVVEAPGMWRGDVFNVGTGRAVTIRELAETILDLNDYQGSPNFAAPRPGDIRHSVASVKKLENALGWRPSVSLYEGLSDLFPRRLRRASGQLEVSLSG